MDQMERKERKPAEEVLGELFRLKPIDKYLEALEKLIIDTAVKKIISAKKPSQRLVRKMNKEIESEFRRRLDKNILFSGFKYRDIIKQKDEIKFYSSLNHIYKTKHGRIYYMPSDVLKRVFITSHALDRFELRIEKKESGHGYETIQYLRKKHEMNTFKFVCSVVTDAISYHTKGNHLYLLSRYDKIQTVIITVLEKRKDIFIVKTILTGNLWRGRNDINYNKDFILIEQEDREDLAEFYLSRFEK